MSIVVEFFNWILESFARFWSAISTDWGLLGIAMVAIPVFRKLGKLFNYLIKGGFR